MALARKRIVIVTALLLGVLLALALTVHVLLGGDRIKAAIESQASAALGHPVTIATAPRLLPRIGLDLTGITIGAAREVRIDLRRDDRLPRAAWRTRRRRRGVGRTKQDRCSLGDRAPGCSCQRRSQPHGSCADRVDHCVDRVDCAQRRHCSADRVRSSSTSIRRSPAAIAFSCAGSMVARTALISLSRERCRA